MLGRQRRGGTTCGRPLGCPLIVCTHGSLQPESLLQCQVTPRVGLHGDFCTNMKGWTSSLVATDKPPLVHSLSYGGQAKLDQLQRTSAQVADIEADFTKLAFTAHIERSY